MSKSSGAGSRSKEQGANLSEVRLRSGRVYSTSSDEQSPKGASGKRKSRRKRGKMEENVEEVGYVTFNNGRKEEDGGGANKKYFEMKMMRTGEKANLLLNDTLLGEDSSEEESMTHHMHGGKGDAPESFWMISIQVFIPFLIAGMGMVGAGIVLDVVQHWEVFMDVPEVFILVPALLGLKGNLEMTLASRLSTQANLGNMDSFKSQWQMSLGNLSLVQCQAIVVGFLASVAAVILGWIPDGHFDVSHALILCTSSVVTASIASLVLGAIMIFVIIMSRYLNINPDNVATPIAASLGDLTTLSLLAMIASSVHGAVGKF